MVITLVTHDSVAGRYVAATLAAAGRVDRVIVETAGPRWSFYWRKIRRVGPVNAVFQLWLNRWFRREVAKHLPDLPLPPHERVPNVNGRPFGDGDLVIGFGTSYITAATLGRMRHGFLNLHTGLLPYYRGVKSEFWTLHQRDVQRAGWTLHFMTPRLDEGDIVLQGTVKVDGENPAQLRAKLLQDAVPAIGAFIDTTRTAGFGSIPRRPQQNGQYFTTPTWSDWRHYRKAAR